MGIAVLEDPEQVEAKMSDLDTAELEKIAQDECLGNKAEDSVVKERTPEESDLAHTSEDLEERINYGSDWGGVVIQFERILPATNEEI